MKKRNAKANEKSKATIKPSKSALKAAQAAADKRTASKATKFQARQPQASVGELAAEKIAQDARDEKSRQHAIKTAQAKRDDKQAKAEAEAEAKAKAMARDARKAEAEAKAQAKAESDKLQAAQARVARNVASYDTALRDAKQNSTLANECVTTLKSYAELIGLNKESKRDDLHALFRISRGGFILPPLNQTFDKIASLIEVEKQSTGKSAEYLPADKKRICNLYNLARKAHELYVRSVKDSDRTKHTLRGREGKTGAATFRSVTSVALNKDKLKATGGDKVLTACMTASNKLLFANAERQVMGAKWMASDVTIGTFNLWRKLRPVDSATPGYVMHWSDKELSDALSRDTPAAIAFTAFKAAATSFLAARAQAKAKAKVTS